MLSTAMNSLTDGTGLGDKRIRRPTVILCYRAKGKTALGRKEIKKKGRRRDGDGKGRGRKEEE